MKLQFLITSLAGAVLLSLNTSCISRDAVCGVLGMPTTEEIEAKRELIAETEELKAKMAEKIKADSIAAIARQQQALAVQKADKQIIVPQHNRYYVIIGAFRSAQNVAKCKAHYEQFYDITTWQDSHGLIFLAVGGHEQYAEAERFLKQVKIRQPQAWIYKKKM